MFSKIWPKLLNMLLVYLFLIEFIQCDQTSASISTTIIANTIEMNLMCDSHENCSSRIFSLDTYCCQSTLNCCNWFEYSTSYQYTKSTLPFRAPSILTILIILILIVCLLFISYCFSILFCFCFKCGLFKRPKIILISSGSSHNSNTESGSTTADLIISPKHSTSSSSSSSSIYSNRNRNNTRSKSNQRSKRLSSRNARQSPTARAYSNSRRQRDQELFLEYEADSPFLIPNQLVPKTRTNRASRAQPSAPIASDDFISNRDSIRINEPSIASSITSSLGFGEVIELADSINRQQQAETHQAVIYLDEKPPSYDVAVAAYQSIEFYNH